MHLMGQLIPLMDIMSVIPMSIVMAITLTILGFIPGDLAIIYTGGGDMAMPIHNRTERQIRCLLVWKKAGERRNPMKQKNRLIHYLLLALILVFFVIPLSAVCLFDCNFRFHTPSRIASTVTAVFR